MNAESNSSHPRPTFSELLDFAEGRLSGAEHERISGFIAEHPQEIAAEWAWVQDFLRKAQTVSLHPMPAGLQDRLSNLGPASPAVPSLEKASGWVETVRRVVAELVDPGLQPDFATAGLRSKAFDSTARQWTFTSGGFDILVNALVRPDRRYDLHGQVFPGNEDAGATISSAQLVCEDREFSLATVDDYGEFLIQGVPAGAYELVIAGEEIEVVCTPVTFTD